MEPIKTFNNRVMPQSQSFLTSPLVKAARQQFAAMPIQITDKTTGWQWTQHCNSNRAYPVPLVIEDQDAAA